MMQNKAWLKFLITGNPKDYLDYKSNKNQQDLYRGEDAAYYDRWTSDKRDEYKG
jgi:hypothetical protein